MLIIYIYIYIHGLRLLVSFPNETLCVFELVILKLKFALWFVECTWTRPRVRDPTDKSLPCLGKKRRLIWMIRPPAPPVLRENEIGEHPLTGMAVIFDNIYKIGDIVDWWKDDVFWTSNIAEVYSSSVKVSSLVRYCAQCSIWTL